ncbi:hypothetical protein DXG01_013722 [Tephrocybe rancida]|nr:hypothetical protein DXG01_013722 [Tephrocybe rancida]
MIGPTSTFYDPDALEGQTEGPSQYQQWIDAFGSQQQHQHQPMTQHSAHQQRPAQYQQQSYRQDPHHISQTRDQYAYSRDQYSQASHYVDSVPAAGTHSGVMVSTAPLADSTSYHIQAASDPYAGYYSQSNPATGTNTPDPNKSRSQSASYATTPEPLYQTQQQAQQLIPSQQSLGPSIQIARVPSHSRSHSQNSAQTYVSVQNTSPFTSEVLGARAHSNPHSSHSSSLSPASNSWTEEVYPTNSASKNNSTQSRTDVAAEPITNPKMSGASSKPTGGKLRKQAHQQNRMTATTASPPDLITPKATAKRKRPNPGAALPPKLYRFDESGSGTEDDELGIDNPFNSGGISVGMGGMGVIGGGGRGIRL